MTPLCVATDRTITAIFYATKIVRPDISDLDKVKVRGGAEVFLYPSETRNIELLLNLQRATFFINKFSKFLKCPKILKILKIS